MEWTYLNKTVTGCRAGYEPVNAWFEGFEWGCICAGASKFPQVNLRKCTDQQLLNSQCYDVPELSRRQIQNQNGKMLCLKRDAQITYSAIISATVPDSEISCPVSQCTTGNFTYCAIECPVTQISFNLDHSISIERSDSSQPVVDLILS